MSNLQINTTEVLKKLTNWQVQFSLWARENGQTWMRPGPSEIPTETTHLAGLADGSKALRSESGNRSGSESGTSSGDDLEDSTFGGREIWQGNTIRPPS
jgi:hypothetical protein